VAYFLLSARLHKDNLFNDFGERYFEPGCLSYLSKQSHKTFKVLIYWTLTLLLLLFAAKLK